MNSEAKTQEVFKDGYYLTGDKAYYDEEGYFWFIGRSDDIILSAGWVWLWFMGGGSGRFLHLSLLFLVHHAVVLAILHTALCTEMSCRYRIGPFEVESCLLEHPAVAESAVVSSPDSLRGEVVKAFVVLAEGYKDTDPTALVSTLQQHVKENTAPYKYPRKVCQDNFAMVASMTRRWFWITDIEHSWSEWLKFFPMISMLHFSWVYSVSFNLHILLFICEVSCLWYGTF